MVDEVIEEHIRLLNEEEKDLKVTQPMPKGKNPKLLFIISFGEL